MTKKQISLIESYRNNVLKYGYRFLSDVYERCSIRKKNAELCILNEMEYYNGYGYTIMSYNTTMFTCAYIYEKGGNKYMVYHTPTNRIEFVIESEV